ncbi:trans-aconitate 2-methyltransferase [Alicyclobacillus sp. SP_1]|jgi:tRNA (cmo5U34)-methyltransferase|uniref:class I SAM-dependent methyltransferase n=1 Tax=Alicyclobacillus sp. SP_1 TaxID=2942475 RepID=UPI0021579704|nr:class I SAM-dependent methyltransferase [Alicyclobacillus sp. SP_1]
MSNEWTDNDSGKFLNLVDVITPSRYEQMNMLTSLIPAGSNEEFRLVELGCGGGELASLILEKFRSIRYLGLDGSSVMLDASTGRTRLFEDRVEFQLFDLDSNEWRQQLPKPIRCFVSSLVVHHLNDEGKRNLYSDLYDALEPGGAVLLIDIVMPHHPIAQSAVGTQWDVIVKEQSKAMTGSEKTFDEFKNDGWNCYSHPDSMDMPASLFDQLTWMTEIGFSKVDCFWQRAGHAVFGGYKLV